MTENKRFKVYKVIGRFHEWSVEDTVDDKVVFDNIMFKYSADKVCNKLNELNDGSEELRKDNQRLRMKIESLNENFNRLNKLFNEVEDVDEDLMIEYMMIVGRTIDE